MQQYLQNKKGLVQNVFNQVYDQYDLMNDFMSFGIHRVWKKNLINMMNSSANQKLIDVACGTGDIAKLFYKKTNKTAIVTCVEPNEKMLEQGKIKLKNYNTINWISSKAEKIPVKDDTFDYYSISYGIRNVTNINIALKEALRVLKPGGRFMCLEFSKIDSELIDFFYKQYAKTIPLIGKLVVGSEKPYEYLVDSIKKFYNQEQLAELMRKNGFSNVEFRNLSSGVSAIYSGWKI